jgi:phospholipid N-methyltransferase
MFLRKFVRDPGNVASVWPSSRRLASAMVRGIELPPHAVVIELGPGTGPFTDVIAELWLARGDVRYLGIDRDPEFVALLRARHPRLDFAHASAFDLPQLLSERRIDRVDAVLCGLPLVSMPTADVDQLLHTVRQRLRPGGAFRTFSYVHTMANPASWSLRRRMRAIFPRFTVRGPVLRNVPPALVFAGDA